MSGYVIAGATLRLLLTIVGTVDPTSPWWWINVVLSVLLLGAVALVYLQQRRHDKETPP